MPIKDLLISTLPEYSEKLVSGKHVNFRPLIVSEEKAILIAKQSGNKQTLLQTLINVLSQCFNKEKIEKQTIWDFENMFLLLRSKSIGEIEKFELQCPETKETVISEINLLKDIVLSNTIKTNNKIKINDDLVLIFETPTVNHLLKFPEYTNKTEHFYGFIANCLQKIQTKKEAIVCSELPEKERIEFIQSLTSNQFKLVMEYFNSLPSLYVICSYKTNDDKERQLKIKGILNLINFFFEHLDLRLFYQQNFEMKYNHKYSLEEIENMIPWERTIYLEQIRTELKEKQQRELTNG